MLNRLAVSSDFVIWLTGDACSNGRNTPCIVKEIANNAESSDLKKRGMNYKLMNIRTAIV